MEKTITITEAVEENTRKIENWHFNHERKRNPKYYQMLKEGRTVQAGLEPMTIPRTPAEMKAWEKKHPMPTIENKGLWDLNALFLNRHQ